MDPQDKNEEEPDLKRQKLEVDEKLKESSPSSPCSSGSPFSYDSDDVRLFEEEHIRSGDYDFDESKVGRFTGFRTVYFENSDFAAEPKTHRDFIERLCKIALDKYNVDKEKKVELVRAVKANFNPGSGITFSITLEAKGASHSEPIPFLAKVGYLPLNIRVYDVMLKQ